MRILGMLAVMFGLAACEPASTPQAVPGAVVEEAVTVIVDEYNTKRGEAIGTSLINAGGLAQGNTATLMIEAREELATSLRSAPRGEVQAFMRTRFRQVWCADPSFETFVQAGGVIETIIVDAIGRRLAATSISNC